MKTILYIILLPTLFSTYSVFTQPINSLLQDVALPTPNAGALGKYGDIPVNHFTGIPQINIPLYTLQEGSLSLPITLNYHASGIKVAETASWVGLGWSLNAGGMITRTVLGLPDEKMNGYYNAGKELNDTALVTLQEVVNGNIDSEPDIFAFNFAGFTGKFYIDQQQKPHLIPMQDIRIDVSWQNEVFKRFTIYAPNGTRYHFGNAPGKTDDQGIETTRLLKTKNSGDPALDHTPTNWYLCQIETPDGLHTINFSYVDEFYSYTYPASCQAIFTKCVSSGLEKGAYRSSCNGRYDTHFRTYTLATNVAGKRLNTITTTSGHTRIHFTGNQVRKDLDANVYTSLLTATSLDEIQVYRGERCLGWRFSYDYYEDDRNGSRFRSENMRLKLTALQQYTCQEDRTIQKNNTMPPHIFSYEGDRSHKSTFLPNRLSKATDHWGFYNAAESNENPTYKDGLNIPQTIVKTERGEAKLGNSNRSSEGSAMMKGILRKITYPTGGTTLFTFEPNVETKRDTLVEEDLVFHMENCRSIFEGDVCCENHQYKLDRSLTQAQIDSGRFLLQYHTYDSEGKIIDSLGITECFTGEEQVAEVKVQVYRVADNSLVGAYETSANRVKGEDSVSIDEPLSEIEIYDKLQPGTLYRFILSAYNGRGYFKLFTREITADTLLQVPVGGLRIKEIRTSPDKTPGENDIIKTFSYTHPLSPSKSSISLFQKPTYGYGISLSGDPYQYSPISDAQSAFFYDQSVVPLGTFEGYHIGYQYVTEHHNGNGYKLYTHVVENPPKTSTFIPQPPQLASILNGKIKQEKIFAASGEEPVRQVDYTPHSFNYLSQPDELIFKVRRIDFDCGSSNVPPIYVFKTYQPRTAPYLIKTQTVLQDGITQATTYNYESPFHLLPTSTHTLNSDGTARIQRYKYPLDYAPGTLLGEKKSNVTREVFVALHMVSPVIEQQVWIKPTYSQTALLSESSITIYQSLPSITGRSHRTLRPHYVYTLNAPQPISYNEQIPYKEVIPPTLPFEKRVYFQYDVHGNLVEQTPITGIPTSYLWGYDHRLPVAEISGVTYEALSTVIHPNDAMLQLPSHSDHLMQLSEYIRSQLPEAQVTTYTYDPGLQVNSVTQPDGTSEYYQYDDWGRLSQTRNHEKKLLQQIRYHYLNP